MQAIIVPNGTPEEIAALVLAVQERREGAKYVLVREPYQTNYSMVKVCQGRESSVAMAGAVERRRDQRKKQASP